MTGGRLSWRETLRAAFSGRMLIALLMGFSSGLPLLLTGSVLQAWLKDGGIDLTRIGLFALVGLPYTLKFLWSPLFDRYALPLGRRRGWMALMQLSVAGALLLLSMTQPAADHLWLVMLAGLLVTFFAASQDIVIDAYRRESMAESELGLGSALYVNGYRVGMLLAGGGGLILADWMSFEAMYRLMAVFMAACVVVTLLAPDTPHDAPVGITPGRHLKLYFHDIVQPMEGHVPPGAGDAETEKTRVANARTLRTRLNEILKADPNADVLLGGDFNSQYNQSRRYAKTMKEVRGGPRGGVRG